MTYENNVFPRNDIPTKIYFGRRSKRLLKNGRIRREKFICLGMKWDKLNQRQLGQYGEYYAKMEFASYGYDVYTSEVDDHGVDFVARDIVTGTFYEVQVKVYIKVSIHICRNNI